MDEVFDAIIPSDPVPADPVAESVADPVAEKQNDGACSKREFQCDNGKCINENDICNGNDDCGDGSDETEADLNKRSCRDPCYYFGENGQNGGCDKNAHCISRQRHRYAMYKRLQCKCKVGMPWDGEKCAARYPEPNCFANLRKYYEHPQDFEDDPYDKHVYYTRQAYVTRRKTLEKIAKRFWMNQMETSIWSGEMDLSQEAWLANKFRNTTFRMKSKKKMKGYFEEWKLAIELDGPFNTADDIAKATEKIMESPLVDVGENADIFEGVADGTWSGDMDGDKAPVAFNECFFGKNTEKVQVYNAGDSSTVGFVIVSKNTNKDVVALALDYQY
jgi:hypothetical protein